jgi:hypothetical protein
LTISELSFNRTYYLAESEDNNGKKAGLGRMSKEETEGTQNIIIRDRQESG